MVRGMKGVKWRREEGLGSDLVVKFFLKGHKRVTQGEKPKAKKK
jgi:hypothetical protein